MEKRIYSFDTLKFLLIFLVLFGHMMESSRDLSFNSQIYSCIYLFHMPLFIFISGFFSKKRTDMKDFWKSEFTLLETLVVFHLGSLLFKKFVLHDGLDLADLVIPGFGSWYLLSLIYWRAVLQFLPSKWISSKWLLPAAVIISLAGGFVPIGGPLSIQRTFTFLPFFLGGYLVKENGWIEKIKVKPWIGAVALACIFVSVFFLNGSLGKLGIGTQFQSVMMGTYTYFKGSDYISHPLLYRALFLVLSSVTCCMVLSVIPEKKVPVATDYGKYTLFLYVYHAFVYRSLFLLFPLLSIEKNTLNLFLGAIVIMAILVFLCKIPFLHYVLNPVTKTIGRSRK